MEHALHKGPAGLSVLRRLVPLAMTAFALAGLGMVVIAFTPSRFGSPEWEIAFFGQMSANLALPMIGVAGLTLWAVSRGSRLGAGTMAAVILFLGAACAVGALMVLLNAPVVWNLTRGAQDTMAGAGYRLVTIKALLLCGVYAMMSVVLAWKAIRSVF